MTTPSPSGDSNHDPLEFRIELITPARAKEMLQGNRDNRPIRMWKVKQYEADIRAGRFMNNGDTVRLGPVGSCLGGFENRLLLDAQHRLWGIVEADIPVLTGVAYNVPVEAHGTIDKGTLRSAADELAWRGFTHTTQLAAAGLCMMRYDLIVGRRDGTRNPTQLEQMDFIDQHPLLIEAAMHVGNRRVWPLRRPSAIATALAYLMEVDAQQGFNFVDALHSGVGLTTGSPLLALRNFGANQAARRSTPRAELCVAIVLKTWNHLVEGRTIKHLAFREDEAWPLPLKPEQPLFGDEGLSAAG